jgi:hypothetical protein
MLWWGKRTGSAHKVRCHTGWRAFLQQPAALDSCVPDPQLDACMPWAAAACMSTVAWLVALRAGAVYLLSVTPCTVTFKMCSRLPS